jgi:hypothetical protein
LVGRWLSFRSFFIAFVCCPHWYCWFDCHLTGIAVVIICTVRSLTGYVVRLLFPHCFYFRPRNLCLHSWPSAECMFIAVLNTGCRSQFFFAPVSAWSFNWWAVAIDGYCSCCCCNKVFLAFPLPNAFQAPFLLCLFGLCNATLGTRH